MDDLKSSLEKAVQDVLGHGTDDLLDIRWIDAYFPFTNPSLEMEVLYRENWLEVLGCGVIHPGVLKCSGLNEDEVTGWAFGIGLERLAMAMFDIPDIRLFWSKDQRFLSQFKSGNRSVKFEPYSKFPPCIKDISFWVSPGFVENNFFASVREVAGDLVEKVEMLDEFHCNSTGRISRCYRISYRSMDRNLTNDEVDSLQNELRNGLRNDHNYDLR